MEPRDPDQGGVGDETSEFTSLADALQSSRRLPSADRLLDEDLVNSPDCVRQPDDVRAEIRRIQREIAASRLAVTTGDKPFLGPPEIADRQVRLRILGRILAESLERQSRSIARKRPAGCWCLGLGGWGRVVRGKGEREVDETTGRLVMSVEWMLVDAATQRALVRAEQYCPCPDGQSRRESEARLAASWLAGRRAGQKERTLEALWKDAGLSPITPHDSLDTYPRDCIERKETVARLKKWRPTRGLYLYGERRRGKTTLARALAKHALEIGLSRDTSCTLKFWPVVELLDHLRANIRDDDGGLSQERLMTELVALDYLVLDDMGVQTPSAFGLERLSTLLDKRLTERKCTIITSNFALGDGRPIPGDKTGSTDLLTTALMGSGNVSVQMRSNAFRIEARIAQISDAVRVSGPPIGGDDRLPEREW